MFVSVGVGAFAAGIFHLMTHAFFKALLFLGAGSVMHAMGNETDIYKMGGLRKKMPATFWTFLIATAAISGFPLFSGFFSKDEILWMSFSSQHGHWGLWLTLWDRCGRHVVLHVSLCFRDLLRQTAGRAPLRPWLTNPRPL